MKYEEIFDVIVELDYIKNTTNNDTEFTTNVLKFLEELREQENI